MSVCLLSYIAILSVSAVWHSEPPLLCTIASKIMISLFSFYKLFSLVFVKIERLPNICLNIVLTLSCVSLRHDKRLVFCGVVWLKMRNQNHTSITKKYFICMCQSFGKISSQKAQDKEATCTNKWHSDDNNSNNNDNIFKSFQVITEQKGAMWLWYCQIISNLKNY